MLSSETCLCPLFCATILGLLGLFWLIRRRRSNEMLSSAGKAVFITGCDTGFGKEAAFRFHDLGYTVFAGCLDAKSALVETYYAVKSSSRFFVVQQDVTSQIQVDQSVAEVEKWLSENSYSQLFAVINNAGIGIIGPMEWVTMSQLSRVLEVNVTGVARVTKAMLPLIRRGRSNDGRVVAISSAAGLMTFPGAAIYCPSKSAVLSFIEILRTELKPFGIQASAICPDFYNTPIVTNTERTCTNLDVQVAAAKSETYHAYGGDRRVAKLKKRMCEEVPALAKTNWSPVIDDMVHAVASTRPRRLYRPMERLTKTLQLLHDYAPGLFEAFSYKRWKL